jgi:hypothetical protein
MTLRQGSDSDASQMVYGRCPTVRFAEIVIQQVHVPPGYLKGCGTVAENALQAEDITTIGQKCPGERVA